MTPEFNQKVAMLSFIARRLAATLLVLLAASFVVYQLTAISGDPLTELRGSRDPNIQQRIAYLTDALQLDVPPSLRYFLWLGGAAGCLVGRCDLGIAISKSEMPVTEALGSAMFSTLQLITIATILSILIGVAVGMTTALRQYSGYDYTVTFFAFVFYSLPIFWVAVLLKEYGAIRFNRFLGDPVIPIPWLILIGLGFGLVLAAIVGGSLIRRLKVFGFGAALAIALLVTLNLTQWLKNPALGPVGVMMLGTLAAALALMFTTGLESKRSTIVLLALPLAAGALWLPSQYIFFYLPAQLSIPAALLMMCAVGVLLAILIGADAKKELARTAGVVGFLTGLFLVIDEALQYWGQFTALLPMRTGFISTIGAVTPSIAREDNLWLNLLDSYSHLLLPTIALMIVSVAGYTRYSRASLLEVLNQDYIRTARSKGLGERRVVVRHAFRNAMIPITTIIAFDISGLIGGAIITERVFAWEGMGSLFNRGLAAVDVNLVMGFFLVTGLFAVLGNLVADVLYSALDPRIRVQ